MNPEVHRSTIESALRVLDSHAEAYGFDTSPLWKCLRLRAEAWERGSPSEDDVRYIVPSRAPDLATHFTDGRPQVLSASVAWVGYSYELTPGQRSILRDTYGLTPTQTVTVATLECWPGTQHPRTMKVVSDLHVDPRNRKHVLVSAVLNDVGTFFKNAEELDAQERREERFALTRGTLALGRLFDLESEERWAIEDLSGVKVLKRVEITKTSDDAFTVLCLKSGKSVRVSSAEYFTTVEEYAKLYSAPKPRRSKTDAAAMSLEAMIKSLSV